MRFTTPTIILASSAVINAAALPAVEERSFLGDIVGDVKGAVGSVTSDVFSALSDAERALLGNSADKVTSAFDELKSIFGFTETAVKTMTCAFENFIGINKAPNTNGIEWYEDAEWFARFLLTNAIAEYAENKVFTTFESELQLLENGGSDFLGGVAESLGLESSWINSTAVDGVDAIKSLIEGVATTAVNDLGSILKSLKTADTADTFINEAIMVGERSFSSIMETAFGLTGIGAVVSVAIPMACTAGMLLADGVKSIEACTVNNDVVGQILSELQTLSGNCSLL